MPPAPEEEEFARACRRRDPLRADGRTDAVRLLDGAGDGEAFAGLYVDDFAGRWLAQTLAPRLAPPGWLRAAAREAGAASVYWKVLANKEKRGPQPWAGEEVSAPFAVREHGLNYRIDFAGGYSQGIFFDQRDNRAEAARRAAAAPGEAVLNCFAYTCAFSVAAAAGGAATVSVDLSRQPLEWGKENFRLNGLDPAAHEFLAGDTFEWLRRFAKRGRKFGGIVLDPPTFSRNREGKIFRAEADFGRLAELAAPLLAPGGWLLCSTNQRSLPPLAFRRMISGALPGAWRLNAAPMPSDFTGEHYLQSLWATRTG